MNRLIIFILLATAYSCDKLTTELTAVDMKESMLTDFMVTAIKATEEGTVWIGTARQGLIRYKDDQFTYYDGTNSNLTDSVWINDITVADDGSVWLAAEGIIQFDGNDFTGYGEVTTDYYRPVYDIEIDASGSLWTTMSDGTDGSVNNIEGIPLPVRSPSQLIEGVFGVSALAIDENNTIWAALRITGTDTCLGRFSDGSWELYNKEDLGFDPYWIKDLETDSKGNVWGVVDYSLSSRFYEYRPVIFSFDGEVGHSYTAEDTFNNLIIASRLAIDNEDRIWVGGARSVIIFQEDEWIENYTLPNNRTLLALEAVGDEIWAGTDRGIVVFSRQ